MYKSCVNRSDNSSITGWINVNLYTSVYVFLLGLGKTTSYARVYKLVVRAIVNNKKSLKQGVSMWFIDSIHTTYYRAYYFKNL